jgi:hypothetical protein
MDWGAAAEDDNDLRTEEGLRAYAERYSKREGVSLAEAMEHVSAQMERRRKVSAGIITTKPFR